MTVTPGLIIAAPASGSGKTVITLGLLRALRNRGVRVTGAKTGPDYIDPAFHAAATGRVACNLDPWAMRPGTLAQLIATAGHESDLILAEGVMGLFDGANLPGRPDAGSTADLAALTGWPVVLVIAVAWALKLLYWRRIDNAKPVATAESATGLGHIGPVTLFEAPHTGENYIMREMGFQIARKHAAKLRMIALLVGGAVPVVAFAAAALMTGPAMMIACLLGLTGLCIGVLLERWLFFAEAQHAAMLYYGAKAV